MRTFIAVLCCLFTAPLALHSQLQDVSAAPGEILQDRETTNNPVILRGDDIWEETFENGIPADWENSEINGIAYWEYRGPETSPDIYIGSRGSCIPEGQNGSEPINSDSWSDGFVIFDSNYWDDNLGPCIEGFGTGPSPAPHDGYLAHPPIDLSEYEDVFLTFTQFFKEWTNNTEAVLEYKTATTDWTQFYEIEVESGNSTDSDDLEIINVTEYAAGQSEFQVRFHFMGTYYYWMIDDIRYIEPDANNLVINAAEFAEFDIYDTENVSGFDGLQYTMYPDEMPPYFDFTVEVANAGAETQTDVTLSVEIVNTETDEVIYSETSNASNLVPQQISWFTVPDFNMPAVVGEYEIRYAITQNEDDEVPEDNQFVFPFNINDVTFAKDRRATTGIYAPSAQYFTTPYEIGNMFVIGADDMPLHSISVGCGLGSNSDVPIYGAVYKLNINAFSQTELIAQTEMQNTYWEAMNDFGDNKTMVIPFAEPLVLDKDSAYLVVAGVESGPQDVLFATSGDAKPLSSWVRFEPNDWYYMEENPVVRMNFGEVVNIDDAEMDQVSAMECFPNPASDQTNVRFSLSSGANCVIQVHDNVGRIVSDQMLGTLPQGTHFYSVNARELSEGIYTVSLIAGGVRHTKQIVISR